MQPSASVVSFEPGDTGMAAAYATYGYVVIRDAIDHSAIDRLLGLYASSIVPSAAPFFRQSTGRYESNRVSPQGHVQQSFQDIHDFEDFPAFSRAALDLVTCERLLGLIAGATGFERVNLMQTMLFDQNTATPAHQDWWYLDSVPKGHLAAAWIALEDIRAEAGRFYVLAESTGINLHGDVPRISHSQWLERVREYVAANPARMHVPALAKGDVLLWNSRTIHGSLPTIDPAYSRKSLTAHYLPAQFQFGNLFTVKDFIRYKEHNGVRFFRNQPDYSRVNVLKNLVKQAVYDRPRAIALLRRFQGRM